MTHFAPVKTSLKDDDNIVIRAATLSDARALNALTREVFETSAHLITTPDEFEEFSDADQRARIEAYANTPGHLLLVAQAGGELVGALDFQNGWRRRNAHRGDLGLSVHSAWRGRGVGSALMTAFVCWVIDHEFIEVINLDVLEGNDAALALYKKMGFKESGREPYGFRIGPGQYLAGISMTLRIPKDV